MNFLGQPRRSRPVRGKSRRRSRCRWSCASACTCGGNRYELHFEAFADAVRVERANREASLNAIIQRYADRLAHYTRGAPYNWFNFYDFWHLNSSAL